MAGLVVAGDRSETLARGYWPSYNVPYWPEVYNKSGYGQMAAKFGNAFSYELAPRAQIFRRDQVAVLCLFSNVVTYHSALSNRLLATRPWD